MSKVPLRLNMNFDEKRKFRFLEVSDDWLKSVAHVDKASIMTAKKLQEKQDHEDGLPSKKPKEDGDANVGEFLFEIKGARDAVLCTKEDTFLLRRVEHSNSMLVLENHHVVTEKVNELFEVAPCKPKVREVVSILTRHYLTCDELEADECRAPVNDLVTLQGLLDQASASRKQLLEFLFGIGVVSWKGYLRMVDPELLSSIFDAVLTQLNGSSLVLNDINVSQTLLPALYAGFPSIAVDVVLRRLFGKRYKNPEGHCEIDHDVLVRNVAELVLRKAGSKNTGHPSMLRAAFMPEFQRLVPTECTKPATLDSLLGYVVVESTTSPNAEITWVDPMLLPPEAPGLVAELFKLCAVVDIEILKAYVNPVVEVGDNFDHVISKLGRERKSADGSKIIGYCQI